VRNAPSIPLIIARSITESHETEIIIQNPVYFMLSVHEWLISPWGYFVYVGTHEHEMYM